MAYRDNQSYRKALDEVYDNRNRFSEIMTLADYSERVLGPQIDAQADAIVADFLAEYRRERDAMPWHQRKWLAVKRAAGEACYRVGRAWDALMGREDD